MNYSKALIDLISEARRRVPSEDKPSIKLANPDVLLELNKIFKKSNDSVLRAIIKEAFHLAGDGWPEQLDKNEEALEAEKKPRYITKVYRGQTQLIEVKPESYEEHAEKTQRIYRGHRVIA